MTHTLKVVEEPSEEWRLICSCGFEKLLHYKRYFDHYNSGSSKLGVQVLAAKLEHQINVISDSLGITWSGADTFF